MEDNSLYDIFREKSGSHQNKESLELASINHQRFEKKLKRLQIIQLKREEKLKSKLNLAINEYDI